MNLNPFSRFWVSSLVACGLLYYIKVSDWTVFYVVAAIAVLHAMTANQVLKVRLKRMMVAL